MEAAHDAHSRGIARRRARGRAGFGAPHLGGPRPGHTACLAPVAVTIAADRVELRSTTISGGSEATVAMDGVSNVILSGKVRSSCPSAAHGVRIRNSQRVKTSAGHGFRVGELGEFPYTIAAIQLVDIPFNARIRLLHAHLSNAAIGVLAERVGRNGLVANAMAVYDHDDVFTTDLLTGIVFHDVDGARISGSSIADAAVGIELDAASEGNRFLKTSAPPAIDLGTGNCGSSDWIWGLPPC